jgi:hypothetical protein
VLFPDHGVGADRAGDVLKVLLAHIDELGRHLAPDMIVGRIIKSKGGTLCHTECYSVEACSQV